MVSLLTRNGTYQVGCALVFPFFLESCHDALEAQGTEVALFERFAQVCTRQDTTALVEYAIDLKGQGCELDLDHLRRLAEPEDLGQHVGESHVADDGRRLQAVGTGACEGFIDDPEGDLAAHGVSCEQVVALGCDSDLSRVQPTMARGSLVKFACPVSCEECHRKGIARWIETPNDCPWDKIDDRLKVVSEACCAADGADPDAACPRGGPPRACSALCAVTFHSLTMDCGDKLLSLAGEANAERFTAFDELCTSERSVDPIIFLDAIANAECVFCALSCKAALDRDPSSTSGVYTICGPTAEENYDAYCDMETNGGGWELVLRAASSSSTFEFDSPYWTNDQLLNADMDDFDVSADGDAKFVAFMRAPFDEIRGCLRDIGEANCKVYDGLVGYSSPQELFNTAPVGSSGLQFSESRDEMREWLTINGMSCNDASACNWVGSGINMDDDTSDYQASVRFGILLNNEGNINTANDAVGFGLREAGGETLGAGLAKCCSSVYPSSGTIWVRTSDDMISDLQHESGR